MATIINTPSGTTGDNSSAFTFLIGAILLVAMFFLFVYYGLPALRGGTQAPSVEVPSQINVDINPQQ